MLESSLSVLTDLLYDTLESGGLFSRCRGLHVGKSHFQMSSWSLKKPVGKHLICNHLSLPSRLLSIWIPKRPLENTLEDMSSKEEFFKVVLLVTKSLRSQKLSGCIFIFTHHTPWHLIFLFLVTCQPILWAFFMWILAKIVFSNLFCP